MKPSVKTLESAFPGKGKILRELLTSIPAVMRHPAALELMRQSYGRPNGRLLRLAAISAEIGGFGVEYIAAGHNAKSPAIEYVNMGDPYVATIMVVNGTYRVGCWGDIVERGRYD